MRCTRYFSIDQHDNRTLCISRLLKAGQKIKQIEISENVSNLRIPLFRLCD